MTIEEDLAKFQELFAGMTVSETADLHIREQLARLNLIMGKDYMHFSNLANQQVKPALYYAETGLRDLQHSAFLVFLHDGQWVFKEVRHGIFGSAIYFPYRDKHDLVLYIVSRLYWFHRDLPAEIADAIRGTRELPEFQLGTFDMREQAEEVTVDIPAADDKVVSMQAFRNRKADEDRGANEADEGTKDTADSQPTARGEEGGTTQGPLEQREPEEGP